MPFVPVPGVLRERALAKLLPQNGLLALLPQDVRERLLPHLALADLPAGHRLGQADGSFARAYFPITGVVALVESEHQGGERIGALVGHEGVVGLPRFMSDAAVTRVVVQSAGYGLALGRDPLLEEWGRGGALMRILMRYSRAVAAQKVVLASCRTHHPLEQQLASLLLLSLDRMHGQEVLMSQDGVAPLLGVTATQLGAAVDLLRDAGAAEWRGTGQFAVQDNAALRALACACASRVEHEYQRLLSTDAPPPVAAAGASTDAAARRAARDPVTAAGDGSSHERPHGG